MAVRPSRYAAAFVARLCLALFVACLAASPALAQPDSDPAAITVAWDELPPLPAPRSGHMTAGFGGGGLIAMGGTDFPTSLFQGGTKTWYDQAVVLEPGADAWQHLEGGSVLPRPLGYAAVATVGDRVVVAGGSDAVRHYADAFTLSRDATGRWTRTALPPLPAPRAMAGTAVVGSRLYVVGGQASPTDTSAATDVFALDLDHPAAGWRMLPPLPAQGRILPVVAAQGGAILVASGAALTPGLAGNADRTYLTDTWRLDVDGAPRWTALSAAPRAAVAAPALAWGQAHVLVFGGDTGALASRTWDLRERHPGFARDVLAYHFVTDTWATVGQLPRGLVTTTAVRQGEAVVIAGGEDRPGHRADTVMRGRIAAGTRGLAALDYVVLAAYLLPLLWIGHHFSRDNETRDDFFLGARRVPWWAAGLSIYGTQLSAITFLAIPAKAYAEDWTYLPGNLSIVLIAPVVVAFYLPFFRGLQITTAYEYLERRFNLATRLLASGAFVALQWARMAIVLYLPSLALAAVTGLDVRVSILLMGVLCTIYTLEGGMRAVIWTDVMQVVLLLAAAVVSLVLLLWHVDGGLSGALSLAMDAGKLRVADWRADITVASVWVVVLGNLVSHLIPYTADQAVVQRYLTTRDEAAASRAVWMGAGLAVPTSLLFFALGTALFAFYSSHPARLSPGVATDAIFAWYIAQELPMGVSGLLVAGVFAAAMSTLSSGINSITAAIVTDVSVRLRPQATEASHMRLARMLSVVVGAVGTLSALLLATWDVRSLWDAFLQALGLFGGGLAGLFVLGILTRRATGTGAIIGFVVSGLVLAFVQQYTSIHFLLYAVIGTSCAVIVGYAASLATAPPGPSIAPLTFAGRRAVAPTRESGKVE